jgi:hypothetical protein
MTAVIMEDGVIRHVTEHFDLGFGVKKGMDSGSLPGESIVELENISAQVSEGWIPTAEFRCRGRAPETGTVVS